MTVTRIISGGQTGADRGGLDAAMALRLAHGGWCPAGRRAEDGTIPARYALRETPSSAYEVRTRLNIQDADGTLLFTMGAVRTPGSRSTLRCLIEHGKQYHHCNLAMKDETTIRNIRRWLDECAGFGTPVKTLNIAGTRESLALGIGRHVQRILIAALRPPIGLERR
jgi:hypothetical protein